MSRGAAVIKVEMPDSGGGELEVEDLWVRRGRVDVLKNIQFTVRKGEAVAILGLNGSGKTTLLRSISGLISPVGGTIRYRGHPIGGEPAHRVTRLGIAYMQQSNQLFPQMSVGDNLTLAGYRLRRDEARARVDSVVESFPRLRSMLHAKAGNLSGGERQALALAKTLVMSPQLLLLDEPTAGLAPSAIAGIYSSLSSLRGTGLTILLVEQNVTQALEIADRIIVLYLGRVHAELSAEQAKADLDLLSKRMMGESVIIDGGRAGVSLNPPS